MATTRPETDDFTHAVQSGVHTLLELKRLEANTKLSAEAFIDAACAIAQCDRARLTELNQLLESTPGADRARQFVRTLIAQFKTPNFPCPFDNPAKALRSYASEEAGHQLAELGSNSAEAQAVAAMLCAERFPEAFGPVVSRKEHTKQVAALRESLDKTYTRLRAVYKGADLTIDVHAVTKPERDAGLAKVSFRCAPNVYLSANDWPQQLVASALAEAEAAQQVAAA